MVPGLGNMGQRGRVGGGEDHGATGYGSEVRSHQKQPRKRPHTSISPSRWQATYDKPLPITLTNLCTPDKCHLCNALCNAPSTSRSHYDGRAHDKRVVQYLAEHVADDSSRPKKVKTRSNKARTREKGECSLCNIMVTSQHELTAHMMGKQHRRKGKRLKEVQEGLVQCELCGVIANNRLVLEDHLRGRRHQEKMAKRDMEEEEEWALHLAQCHYQVMDQIASEFKVEVVVSGIKEVYAKTSSSSDPEPPVKKEKSAQPQNLHDVRISGEVVVEEAVKAPPPHPMMIFKILVTDMVREHLLDYYARDAQDRKLMDGRMKDIKIRNEQEFMYYCKTFSKRFQTEISEAHVAINGSDAGIETVDVRQFAIGYDIDKFFSEIDIK